MTNNQIEYGVFTRLHGDVKMVLLFESTPVFKQEGGRKRKYRMGFFLCECGSLKELNIQAVKSGKIKSCGVLVTREVDYGKLLSTILGIQ